ncbi:olfactory receptor 6E1-like [Tiliqua scincoides]|uniref:olfactory receptor 6E1-like n=1 Tax=Tiliqua scincoides TaxID=71010 RepID=UPI0034635D32
MPKIKNCTTEGDFTLLGFTNNQQLEIILFTLLICTYPLTIIGNMVIIVITLVDPQLDTPMYYFLRHFAFLEIGFTTTIIPKTLANMATGHKTISVPGCFAQSFLYFVLGTTEFFLLAVMSFDRYVAICNPLHYSTIMNSQICSLLVLCSWVGGFLLIMGPAIQLFQMPFCGLNIIDHFFCDSGPLLKLACADTSLLELADFLIATLSLLGTLAINLVSYVKITTTVMRVPSAAGRKKAFSTCVSHIIVVSITYGSCIFMYLKPKGITELDFSKVVAILNTIVAPLLIPFIYCLRNKQVQDALRAVFRKFVGFCKNSR